MTETKRYVGTKTIDARPMTRKAYNDYRGWALPADENGDDAGFLVEYADGGKSNDSRHAGYISWSPADVFERTYKETSANFIQPKITGYRQLSKVEADLMNEIKAKGVELGELVFRLRTYIGKPYKDESGAMVDQIALDQRWVSIGATDLQTGLMALTRAVAQPTTF